MGCLAKLRVLATNMGYLVKLRAFAKIMCCLATLRAFARKVVSLQCHQGMDRIALDLPLSPRTALASESVRVCPGWTQRRRFFIRISGGGATEAGRCTRLF